MPGLLDVAGLPRAGLARSNVTGVYHYILADQIFPEELGLCANEFSAMTQETIRFSDSIVDEVETLVDNGTFDHKSEFYRFATELLLDALRDDYDPEMVNYDRLTDAISAQTKQPNQSVSDGSSFYRSAIVIRQYARKDEIPAAEEHIENHYAPERGEYLLLEALLDYYQNR